MIGENRQLVTNEPVEVLDCMKVTNQFKKSIEVHIPI